MTDEAGKAALAASFDRAAELYERARPSYPAEAIDWLLECGPREVLDLGAGTGKLTRDLVCRVDTLYAVDPSPNMLAQLNLAVPKARTSVGTAEAIPLPDASVDAVLVAQAWHWVDAERAIPEVRRVLRPGGTLGLIWNVRDESVGWVAELTRIIHASAAESFVTDREAIVAGLGGGVERLTIPWQRPMDERALLDLVASRSYVINASTMQRAQILAAVDDLVRNHPDLGIGTRWSLPYLTEAYRVRLP
ncbi:MAG TPA: class I SAM-dependent methyltransferase [Micropruina sp.]|jgi:SAM-dependent methyltransferase|nr:class I SAM-dependent methyltransferase [Micropruina sp.]